MIHLVSAWRRTTPVDQAYLQHIRRYGLQARALAQLTPVHVNIIHGDSVGGLSTALQGVLHSMDLMTSAYRFDHGKPDHGSTELPERLIALSDLLNFALSQLTERLSPEDTVIWVESDLYWDALTMIQLMRYLRRPEVDVVAPMVFAGEAFYDIWGFRTVDGRRWGPFFPWGDVDQIAAVHPLVPMGSVGSCVAMKAHVAKWTRVQNGEALAGWCLDARERGYSLWCAKELRVQHPFDWRRS